MVIAVLMTVFNRKQTTLNCLSHLFGNEVPGCSFKVFLVDDGCTDGTGEAVAQLFPEVNIIKGEGNLFWNRGMYRAWMEALPLNADYYFWLNDDTVLNGDAIAIMLNVSSMNANKCIVTGCLCSPTDNGRVTYGGIINNKVVSPTGKAIECETTNGNALLIPRCVMEKVGILNNLYHHSRGDIDYGYRTRMAGFRILLTPVFVGICERHDQSFKCYNPAVSIVERFQFLYSPLGFKPIEVFTVSKLKGGFFEGIKAVALIHLRTLSPRVWNYVHEKIIR